MRELTLLSLFDGSGGFPLAASMCGIRPVACAEVEPYPIAVTRSRFPNMKHLGSVTDINGGDIERVDIIDLSGEKFEAAIFKIQAADVAPVRHGRWIGCNGEIVDWDENNPGCPRHSCFCSICKSWLTASDEFPVIAYFCPNCGAKMDLEG